MSTALQSSMLRKEVSRAKRAMEKLCPSQLFGPYTKGLIYDWSSLGTDDIFLVTF